MKKIRRNNPNYRLWKKKNDAKKLRNRLSNRHGKQYEIYKKTVLKNVSTYKMPSNFSIRQNPEETIEVFNIVLNEIRKINSIHTEKIDFYFNIDMQDVKNITEDALMYLVTIVKNGKLTAKKKKIFWKVGLPRDEKSREYLQKSGFASFFEHHSSTDLITSDEKFQITTGKKVETQTMKLLCDSVKSKVTDMMASRILYKMLTELMSNTTQHAYTGANIIFIHSWYVFAENTEDEIRVTFMDNGLGIPRTINKKFSERFKTLFSSGEHKLVLSALKGEFRSETKSHNRGKGLPEIYEPSLSGEIEDLTVISNNAFFSEKEAKDIKHCLEGTIFYWKIDKRRKINNDN